MTDEIYYVRDGDCVRKIRVKVPWPIPRKTYPDPSDIERKAHALHQVIDELDVWERNTSNPAELQQIAELALQAQACAIWLRKRAEAAVRKIIRQRA